MKFHLSVLFCFLAFTLGSCEQNFAKKDKIIFGYDDTCSLGKGFSNLFLEAPSHNKVPEVCSEHVDSCCSATYLNLIQQKKDWLSTKIESLFLSSSLPSKCQQRLEKLVCSICSSNQKQYYFLSESNTTNFLLCDENCQGLYDDCGEATTREGERKVKNVFPNSEALCKELFNTTGQIGNPVLHIVPYLGGNSLCFNGGKECSAHDFYSESTECKDGKYMIYYKYKTPQKCQGPLPAPVDGLPCDVFCSEGSYYSIPQKSCVACETGRYSIGGGTKVDNWPNWESLSVHFNNYCVDHTLWPPKNIYPASDTNCDGWTLGDGAEISSLGNVTGHTDVIETSVQFVQPGHVFFSILVRGHQPDVGLRFSIDDKPVAPYTIYDTKSAYQSFEYNVTAGVHLFKWEFGYYWRSLSEVQTHTSASIREIHFVGTAFADIQCYKCPLGTFQNLTGQHECHLCPPNTYSDVRAATDCKPCKKDEYSLEGAVTCTKRQACTLNDVVASYTPCRQTSTNPNGARDLTYTFKQPVICDYENYKLPPNSLNTACEPCPPGFKRVNSECTPCADGEYLDATQTCKECQPGHMAQKVVSITTFNEWQFGMKTGCNGLCSTNKGWRLLGDKMDSGAGLNSFMTDSWTSITVNIERDGLLKFKYNISCSSCHLTIIISRQWRETSFNLLYKSAGEAQYPLLDGENTIQWSFRKNFVSNDNEAHSTISGIWIHGAKQGSAFECTPCSNGTFSNQKSSFCSNCPEGKSSLPGAKECFECPANTYSSSGSSCIPCGKNLFSDPGSAGCHAKCKFEFNDRTFDLSPLKRTQLMYGPFEERVFNYYFNLCSMEQRFSECYDLYGKETRPFACQVLKANSFGTTTNVGFTLGTEMHVSFLAENDTEAIVVNYAKGDPGCGSTRQTKITVTCDLNTESEVLNGTIETSSCHYEFHMRSRYACHLCDPKKDNYTTTFGLCDPKTNLQPIYFTWKNCRDGKLMEDRPCEISNGYQVNYVVIGVVAGVFGVLLIVLIVLGIKYRKMYVSQYSRFQQENPQEIELHHAPTSHHVKSGLMEG